MANCPHCGKTLPAKAKRTGQAGSVDDLALLTSKAARFKYFHDTAPVEDLRFFLAHAECSETLKAEASNLLASAVGYRLPMTRAEWMRRVAVIHEHWRHEKALVEQWRSVWVPLARIDRKRQRAARWLEQEAA